MTEHGAVTTGISYSLIAGAEEAWHCLEAAPAGGQQRSECHCCAAAAAAGEWHPAGRISCSNSVCLIVGAVYCDDDSAIMKPEGKTLTKHPSVISPQAKVAEAREASGGDLSDTLRAAVADNERLNKQLHVLHGNAMQLWQAIADARSLQMHLQQEAADAREL